MSNKYYAVKVGYKTGIFESWDECKKQVDGYSGAQYKLFKLLEEAKQYLNGTSNNLIDALIAYTDGSYNIKEKIYGYGCVLIYQNQIICEYYGKGNNEEHVEMRNVAGEIMGAIKAITYALEHHYKELHIYYDYEGIEKWADGKWKANKPGTQKYVEIVNDAKSSVSISFYKVTAHSGNTYNELADQLAKKAVGLSNE